MTNISLSEALLRLIPFVWGALAVSIGLVGIVNLVTASLGSRWLSVVPLLLAAWLVPIAVRGFRAYRLPMKDWLAVMAPLPNSPESRERVLRLHRLRRILYPVASLILCGVAAWSVRREPEVMLSFLFWFVAVCVVCLTAYEWALARARSETGALGSPTQPH